MPLPRLSLPRLAAAAACAAVVFLAPSQAALPGQERPAAKPAAPVVGTIDFGKAFEAYPRTQKEHERLRQMADGSQQQIDKIKKRIDELRASLQVIAEGSYEHDMKQFELEMAMREQQSLAKLLSDQLEVEEMRVRLAIWSDIDAAVARLAKDRGVDLVLRAEPVPPAADKATPRDVRNRMVAFEQRQVWFAARQLDLTDDLIKLLQVWPLDDGKGADTKGPDTKGPGAKGPDTKGPDAKGPGAKADDAERGSAPAAPPAGSTSGSGGGQ